MSDPNNIYPTDRNRTDLDLDQVRGDSGASRQVLSESEGIGSEDTVVERRDFRIRVADTRGRRSKVSLLIERMYSWRGYQTGTAKELPQNPHHITLVASRNDEVFGTITVGLDSSLGLTVDELYRDELDAIRAEGRSVCEFVKLAVDFNYGTKDALASLFHLAYMYAHRINCCDDIVIEVNPRHMVYYKRMLGFTQAGPERTCERVSAPAVLLRLPCTYAAEQIARHGGHKADGARSLYPYFFSSQEEAGLCARIQHLA
ncbi:MAG: hypothetical protein V4637_04285 [Pseudomonadota bacterium]